MTARASFRSPRSVRALAAAVALAALLALGACSSAPKSAGPAATRASTAATVDLPKYMGRWYVIASIPSADERDYVASQADWKLRDDGRVDAASIGRKGGFDAAETRREVTYTVVPDSGNATWRMRRLWLMSTTQQTLYVDPMVQYTILGSPDKSRGSILSRTPFMPEAKVQEMLTRLEQQGYDIARFRRVPQQREQIGKPGFRSPGDQD